MTIGKKIRIWTANWLRRNAKHSGWAQDLVAAWLPVSGGSTTPLTKTITDTMTLSDGLKSGYSAAIPETISLTDTFSFAGIISKTFTDTVTVVDGVPVKASQLQVTISCVEEASNWVDVLSSQVNPALNFSDALSLSDVMTAGYGLANSDQLVLLDGRCIGYGELFSDTLVASDSVNNATEIDESFNDQFALSDNFVLGYGNLVSDTSAANWSDKFCIQYGNLFAESISFVDVLAVGYGDVVTDSDSTWADNYSPIMSLPISLLDYALIGLDSDATNVFGTLLGSGGSQEAFGQSVIFQHPTTISEVSFNVSSNLNPVDSIQVQIFDALNSGTLIGTSNSILGSSLSASHGFIKFSFSPSVALSAQKYYFQLVRTGARDLSNNYSVGSQGFASQKYPGCGFLQETSGTWAEQANTLAACQIEGVVDAVGAGYGNLVADDASVNWLDSLQAGYGTLYSDQIIIVDSNSSGYGAALLDSETNNWNDSFSSVSGAAQSFTDTLLLSDFLQAGYGIATAEQLILTDFANTTNPSLAQILSDQLAITDLSTLLLGMNEVLSSTVVLSDVRTSILGRLTTFSDQLVLADGIATINDLGIIPADQMVLNDAIPVVSYGLQFSDYSSSAYDLGGFGTGGYDLTWADSLGSTLGELLSLSDQIVESDKVDFVYGYRQVITDSTLLTDKLNSGYGNLLADSESTNWLDVQASGYGIAFAQQLTLTEFAIVGGVPALSEILEDSNSANWLDTGLAIPSIALVLSDAVTNPYGTGGYGEGPYDSTWQDKIESGSGYPLSFTETLNNWQESLREGFGLIFSELIIQSDSFSNINPTALLIAESLNNWNDPLRLQFGLSLLDSNSSLYGNAGYGTGGYDLNWADSITVGESLTVYDTLAQTDRLIIGYSENLFDYFSSAYSSGGYGSGLYDTTWNDLVSLSTPKGMVATDSLNNWSDAFTSGRGLAGTFADNLNNWQDFIPNFTADIEVNVASVLTALWQDSVGLGSNLKFADQLVVADIFLIGYGGRVSDQIVISDKPSIGYGYSQTDQLLEQDSILIGYADAVADALLVSDALGAGTGVLLSDQLTQSELILIGYGLLLADTESERWTETLGFDAHTPLVQESLSDVLFLNDQIRVGYGNLIADQLSFSEAIGVGYGNRVSDTESANWLDAGGSINFVAKILSDSGSANWNDSANVGYGDLLQDSFTISDLLTVQYEARIAEDLAFTELLLTGYGSFLSDSEASNWTDSTVVEAVISRVFADIESGNWLDASTTGYGNVFDETILLQESVQSGYGNTLSDSDVLWSDSVGIGYGYETPLVDDGSGNWLDDGGSGVINSLPIDLSDDFSQLWADGLNSLLLGAVGTAHILRILVKPSLRVYKLRTHPEILVHRIAMNAGLVARPVAIFSSAFSDDNSGNWVEDVQVDSESIPDITFSFAESWILPDLNIFPDSETPPPPDISWSLQDDFSTEYGNDIADDTSQNWADDYAWQMLGDQIQFPVFDSMVFGDAIGLLAWVPVADANSDNWTDGIQLIIGSTDYQIPFFSNLSLSDKVAVGRGYKTAEAITLSDTFKIGMGLKVSNTIANWSDAFVKVRGYTLALSDNAGANWSDSTPANMKFNISMADTNAGNWNDFFPASSQEFSAAIGEHLAITDVMTKLVS